MEEEEQNFKCSMLPCSDKKGQMALSSSLFFGIKVGLIGRFS